MEIKEFGAGILAGGRSTRMGRNKLLLDYRGRSFLNHLLDVCRMFPEVTVSTADPDLYGESGCALVQDELENYGPVEGIYQLLRHSNMEQIFVLAGDMPRMDAGFLKNMAAQYQGEDCLVLQTSDGGIHPLCAIYAKRLTKKLEAMRAVGERRPRRLYEQCQVRYITAEELGYPDTVAANINTPEEYERLVNEHEINQD